MLDLHLSIYSPCSSVVLPLFYLSCNNCIGQRLVYESLLWSIRFGSLRLTEWTVRFLTSSMGMLVPTNRFILNQTVNFIFQSRLVFVPLFPGGKNKWPRLRADKQCRNSAGTPNHPSIKRNLQGEKVLSKVLNINQCWQNTQVKQMNK